MAFDLDSYQDVATRLQAYYDSYPDGRIVCEPAEIKTVGDRLFMAVVARCYRTPDDPTPCVAQAWEPYPGKTNYTKDSEVMNAETSAVGRAIVMAGLSSSTKLASRQEVRNRVAEQTATASPVDEVKSETPAAPKAKPIPKLTADEKRELGTLYVASGWDQQTLALQLVLVGALVGKDVDALGKNPSDDQYKSLIGPAMGALTQEQFKLVKSNLEDSVKQNDANAVAA